MSSSRSQALSIVSGKTTGWLPAIALVISAATASEAIGAKSTDTGSGQVRTIDVDLAKADQPLDRSFNFSVGSDYSATLLRPPTK